MKERETQLRQRRQSLVARCAVQRRFIGEITVEIDQHLGVLDRRISIFRNVIRSRLFIGGVITLLVLVGPRRILHWAARGALFWSTSRQLLRSARQ